MVSLSTDAVLAIDQGDWDKAYALHALLRLLPVYLEVRAELELPPGQARTVCALLATLSSDPPPTYGEVAESLGVHIGTVHTHLRRVRLHAPELYGAVMAERRRQLAAYHELALERSRRRSLTWGRRRAAARHRREHGRWPWESPR